MKKRQTNKKDSLPAVPFRTRLHKDLMYIRRHPGMYLMIIPALTVLLIYKFIPYYGILIAFKDYNIFAGKNPLDAIAASDWVGFYWFEKLFKGKDFMKVLMNTLIINFEKIVWIFPIPILCAIMLNEIGHRAYKRLTQTVIYIPHFFSWVIVYGIFLSLLSSSGVVNGFLQALGFEKIGFFTDTSVFRGVLVFTEGWKSIGHTTIVYLAAITGLDMELFDAARVDGAGRLKQIWHITIPGILPSIVLMLILKVGHILDHGFEQVLLFYNSTVYDVADIIQTYVYRQGIGRMEFSYSAALGLFNSVVAFVLIVGANAISRKTLHRSIW